MDKNTIENYIIRPISINDLEKVYLLAKLAEPGLTSLVKEKKQLETMIKHSEISFAKKINKPGNEFYFFVMENIKTKEIVGTSSIYAVTGYNEPFFYYHVHNYKRKSKILNKATEVQLLELYTKYNGPSEIGTLFLKPKYRKTDLGKFLSFARFLFIASFPKRFDQTIIAEMRGVCNKNGKAPFWESVGKKFFGIEFTQADYLSLKNKQFIGELMPRYPIYTVFLSPKAQAVIGKTHKNTIPALKLLKKQGFRFQNHINIFDGGPKVSALTKKIPTIRKSKIAQIEIKESKIKTINKRLIITNQKLNNFRAALIDTNLKKTTSLKITPYLAKLLKINNKGKVRYINI